jgi:hypothetical protein
VAAGVGYRIRHWGSLHLHAGASERHTSWTGNDAGKCDSWMDAGTGRGGAGPERHGDGERNAGKNDPRTNELHESPAYRRTWAEYFAAARTLRAKLKEQPIG